MDLDSLELEKKNKKIDAVLASPHDELDLDWKHLKDENIEYLSRQDVAGVSSLNLSKGCVMQSATNWLLDAFITFTTWTSTRSRPFTLVTLQIWRLQ